MKLNHIHYALEKFQKNVQPIAQKTCIKWKAVRFSVSYETIDVNGIVNIQLHIA